LPRHRSLIPNPQRLHEHNLKSGLASVQDWSAKQLISRAKITNEPPRPPVARLHPLPCRRGPRRRAVETVHQAPAHSSPDRPVMPAANARPATPRATARPLQSPVRKSWSFASSCQPPASFVEGTKPIGWDLNLNGSEGASSALSHITSACHALLATRSFGNGAGRP